MCGRGFSFQMASPNCLPYAIIQMVYSDGRRPILSPGRGVAYGVLRISFVSLLGYDLHRDVKSKIRIPRLEHPT